jgi:hypothetical protein
VPERIEEYELTDDDWGKVHAKAWREDAFRIKLETDPTSAIQEYALQENTENARNFNLKKLRIVKLRPRPEDVPEEFWDDVNPFPPSCC